MDRTSSKCVASLKSSTRFLYRKDVHLDVVMQAGDVGDDILFILREGVASEQSNGKELRRYASHGNNFC